MSINTVRVRYYTDWRHGTARKNNGPGNIENLLEIRRRIQMLVFNLYLVSNKR